LTNETLTKQEQTFGNDINLSSHQKAIQHRRKSCAFFLFLLCKFAEKQN